MIRFLVLSTAVTVLAFASACSREDRVRVDPTNAAQVASGKLIYEQSCASCHGVNLEGQPDWRTRLPNGRLPAPPHDESGHTWHHPDDMLVGITKLGLVPPYAPAGYESDMPAFGSRLTDEQIRDALAYIGSRWPTRVTELRARQKGGK